MSLGNDDKKHMRRLGHNLNPVVTVASKGLTPSVVQEIGRALADHELIKIKLAVGDKSAKREVLAIIEKNLCAEVVQTIGHVALLYKKAEQANPKLSNLQR